MLGSTFSASAAHVTVHLTKTQAVNSSSNVYGTFKYFWGTNSKSSQHSVHYIARYKNGFIWYTGGQYLIAPGHGRNEKNAYMTKKLDYETDWFLKLNPEGNNTTGCDAWGYMKNA